MKFDGVFTLQAKGNASVRTLFADITQAGHIRGYCAFDDDPATRPLLDDVSAVTGPVRLGPVMGDGYIATVNEVETGGRYQGIVELTGMVLVTAMRWFENSEQLDTTVIVAAGEQSGGWQATALLLQRIASKRARHWAIRWMVRPALPVMVMAYCENTDGVGTAG